MLDTIQILKNVANVNNYATATIFNIFPGSTAASVFFQLFQQDLKLRFVPETGTKVKVSFLRHDTIALTPVSQTVSKYAEQAFPGDRSIWKVDLSESEIAKIVTGGFQVEIDEPTAGKTVLWSNMSIRVQTGPHQV